MPFETNVFINCPFDEEFKKLLNPLLFCVIYLRFEPSISQTDSSAEPRITQIKRRIKNARLSIHDLSRCTPAGSESLPRHNMPFELGIDIGCLTYGSGKLKQKKLLVLDSEPYRYQQYLSDIGGQDIKAHKNEPTEYIRVVRDWLSNLVRTNKFPKAAQIWDLYNKFLETDIKPRYTENEIKTIDLQNYIRDIKGWIKTQHITTVK